jgi:hypothetical protein
VKLYILGYQYILAGHLYLNSKRKENYKNLKSSGSKPSGGQDVAELGSAVVRRASRLFCAFPVFLILVVEDAVWSPVLLPHTCFLLSCMHTMVETKTYPEYIYIYIYIGKNSSTCGILIY